MKTNKSGIVPRLSVQEYAKAMGVSRMTIYRLIKSGRLKADKIGEQWRIPADAIPECQ